MRRLHDVATLAEVALAGAIVQVPGAVREQASRFAAQKELLNRLCPARSISLGISGVEWPGGPARKSVAWACKSLNCMMLSLWRV